jgi:uncharacterized protein (TIGR03435 family)
MHTGTSAVAFVAFTMIVIPALSQTQAPAKKLVFEVASVKPTPPDRQNQLHTEHCQNGGRFAVAGTPVMWSLSYAFGLKDFLIVGAPEWLSAFESAYDMEGKPPRPVNDQECREMVRSLFIDRFKLVAHREMRESSVYLLTVGRGGAKLREGGGVRLNGGVQIGALGTPEWPDGWTMSALADYLSYFAGRPVVDRTGLSGTYGITLDFSREDADHDRPSIFTAVQEQLGLKLDSGNAPVEVLVIDSVQKPSAN